MAMDSEAMMERARRAAEEFAQLPEAIRRDIERRFDALDREAEREQRERESRLLIEDEG